MLAREICQDCETVFMGGPKAFLCPKCRKRRQSENAKKINTERKVIQNDSKRLKIVTF